MVGCKSSTVLESDDALPQPKRVTFEGVVDPQFVGLWNSIHPDQSLDLKKDGEAHVISSHPSPSGVVKSNFMGQWLVASGNLLLKYQVDGQPEMTVKYPASIKGNKLVLDQGSRSKVIYTRSR